MNDSSYVNWIANQSDCFLHNIFVQLKEQVKKDVDEANHFSPWTKKNCKFEFIDQEDRGHVFAVMRRSLGMSVGVDVGVQFALNGASIRVHCPGHPSAPPSNQVDYAFHVKSCWNAKPNQCELAMNNKPCELWEISQNALSHLVFNRS